MSYVVFARKWRPQKFDDVVGQEHIVTTLKNAILKNRLAYAYLFAGSKGIGKTSTARIFAKSLNCIQGPTIEPCQKCTSCVEITECRSLDVIEIDGASNTGVDNIRDLRENAKFSPVNGRYKIYIIDEVHMLSDSAFNALLKILEEPPEHVKFIFATTHPHKVPPTIISRCQRFDFNRIATLKIIEQLKRIVESEKLEVEQETLFAIARASEGSMRDAESILDQLISFSKDRVTLQDVTAVLGSIGDDDLFNIADSIAKKDSSRALAILDKIINEGKDISNLLHNLIGHFRNLMVAKVTGGEQTLLDLPEEMSRRIFEQSKEFSLEEIFLIFNLLVNTHDVSKRLDTLRIPIEIALVKLTHSKKKVKSQITSPKSEKEDSASRNIPQDIPKNIPKSAQSAPEIKIDRSVSQASVASAVASDENNKEDNPDNNIQIDCESILSVWNELIQRIEKIKISIANYLRESKPVATSGRKVTFGFPKDLSFHKEVLERKENRVMIENNLKDLLKQDIRIDFTLTEEALDTSDDELDPIIQSALDTFGGKLM